MQLIEEMNSETNFFFLKSSYLIFSFPKLSKQLKGYNNVSQKSGNELLCLF